MNRWDRWGCPITAPAAEAAVIDQAATDYVTMAPKLDRHFEELAQAGPFGRAMLSQFLSQSHKPALVERARELAAGASSEAADVSGRERHHIDAAVAWCESDIDATITSLGQVLVACPTDAMALRALYILLFNAGRADEMRGLIDQVRPAWSDDLPLASYLDGMEAFALEEEGHYEEAEALGRHGVDQDEADLWAIHSVSHVLEMQGRTEEGIAWLDGRDAVLEAGGRFSGHLWWHKALQLWAADRHDEALDLFDRRVYPDGSEDGLDLSNAISLLVRLEIAGVSVGERWQQLVAPSALRVGHHSYPFDDSHFILGLCRAGEVARADEILAGMTTWADRDDVAGRVLRTVGLATARGFRAFGLGQWREAAEHLAPVATDTWRLGGSHAQRQVYQQVLASAQVRAA